MSLPQPASQNLAEQYSYHLGDDFHGHWKNRGMITLDCPAKDTTIKRRSSSSSLGLLDSLPLELMHLVLDALDLRSISHLSQVSLGGLAVVQSFPKYKELLKYASDAMAALGRTGAIQYHSVVAIYHALCSQSCVSCGHFGAYLLLSTCERCCYECLCRNQALWVISVALAKKCFGLKDLHIKRLPEIRNLPGSYAMGGHPTIRRTRRIRLVSVKAAKALAIQIHGSTANMPDWKSLCRRDEPWTKEWAKNNVLRWLQDAPLQPLDVEPFLLHHEAYQPHDQHAGMASIPFPSFQTTDGVLERGLCCRGCEWAARNLRSEDEETIKYALRDVLPPDKDTRMHHWDPILFGLQYRARSRRENQRHIQNCYGVQRLVAEIREEERHSNPSAL